MTDMAEGPDRRAAKTIASWPSDRFAVADVPAHGWKTYIAATSRSTDLARPGRPGAETAGLDRDRDAAA